MSRNSSISGADCSEVELVQNCRIVSVFSISFPFAPHESATDHGQPT